MNADMERAAAAIRTGGVVAYPTEGVWGLGCNPRDETALNRILSIKQRRREQGLILLAAEESQLTPFIQPFPAGRASTIRASWPGPVTWIVPAAAGCPDWLTGGRDTIAVRVTAHVPARELSLAAETALVSTSANRHGEAPAVNAGAVQRLFGDRVDAILDAPLGGVGGASEIRDAASGKIIRAATPADS